MIYPAPSSLLNHGLALLAGRENMSRTPIPEEFMDNLGLEYLEDVDPHRPLDLGTPPHMRFCVDPVADAEEQARVDTYAPVRGDKDCSNKTDASSVPSAVVSLLSRIYSYGAAKYSKGSWRRGFPDSELASAMERHYLLWRAGEDDDLESGEPHLGHLAWGALTLWMQAQLDVGQRDLDMDPKEAVLVRDLLYGRPVQATKFVPPPSGEGRR